MSSMSNPINIVKLHDCPQLLNDCALLLNEEWPRSLTARLHSLEKSCDSLPISLIVVNKENRLLGHIRVKKEFMDTNSAFIESLVIEKSQRGKGLGKWLMIETEAILKQMGFKTITLTTTDKMGFYRKLGFEFTKTNQSFDAKPKRSDNQTIKSNDINANDIQTQTNPTPPLPPPPPPLPLDLPKSQTSAKVLMHKYI